MSTLKSIAIGAGLFLTSYYVAKAFFARYNEKEIKEEPQSKPQTIFESTLENCTYMDIQRIRNLTTGRLHTDMSHIYEDIEMLIGEKGIMTHMLPNVSHALEPFLRKQIPDEKFWEDLYDTSHIGEVVVKPLDEEEKLEFWKLYRELPNPLSLLGSKA